MKFMFVPALFLSTIAFAQAPAPVTVKPSPAAEALNHAAQDLSTEQKSYDTILQQARSAAEASQKSIQDAIKKESDALLLELKADSKYKDRMAKMETMQKQLQGLSADADSKFNAKAAPIQNKIGTDKALIDGLIPIVREENNLPSTATFDTNTQKWTAPKVVENPSKTKK